MSRICGKSFTVLVLALFTLTCASNQTKGSYKRYEKKTTACCNGLADEAARSQCLADLPRVDAAYAETRELDREASCFDANFTCDGTTGKPTQESAQKIHDCMNG